MEIYINSYNKELYTSEKTICNYTYDKKQGLYVCIVKDSKFLKGYKKFYGRTLEAIISQLKTKL